MNMHQSEQSGDNNYHTMLTVGCAALHFRLREFDYILTTFPLVPDPIKTAALNALSRPCKRTDQLCQGTIRPHLGQRRKISRYNMSQPGETTVGIDVGGEWEGFHALALLDGHFVDKKANPDPTVIVNWCIRHKATVVAVDAPCRWSLKGSSRLAERELKIAGERIHCFATPTYK